MPAQQPPQGNSTKDEFREHASNIWNKGVKPATRTSANVVWSTLTFISRHKLGAFYSFLALCGLLQFLEARKYTDKSPWQVATYMRHDTVEDLRDIANLTLRTMDGAYNVLVGDKFSNAFERSASAQYILVCHPRPKDTINDREIGHAPHLATALADAEDNVRRQVRFKTGNYFIEVLVSMGHQRHPVVTLRPQPDGTVYTDISHPSTPVTQTCSEKEGMVERGRIPIDDLRPAPAP